MIFAFLIFLVLVLLNLLNGGNMAGGGPGNSDRIYLPPINFMPRPQQLQIRPPQLQQQQLQIQPPQQLQIRRQIRPPQQQLQIRPPQQQSQQQQLQIRRQKLQQQQKLHQQLQHLQIRPPQRPQVERPPQPLRQFRTLEMSTDYRLFRDVENSEYIIQTIPLDNSFNKMVIDNLSEYKARIYKRGDNETDKKMVAHGEKDIVDFLEKVKEYSDLEIDLYHDSSTDNENKYVLSMKDNNKRIIDEIKEELRLDGVVYKDEEKTNSKVSYVFHIPHEYIDTISRGMGKDIVIFEGYVDIMDFVYKQAKKREIVEDDAYEIDYFPEDDHVLYWDNVNEIYVLSTDYPEGDEVTLIIKTWKRTPVSFNLYREKNHGKNTKVHLFITDKDQRKKGISDYEPMANGFKKIMQFVDRENPLNKIYIDYGLTGEEIDSTNSYREEIADDSDSDSYSDGFNSDSDNSQN
jgi:hypothetical protein